MSYLLGLRDEMSYYGVKCRNVILGDWPCRNGGWKVVLGDEMQYSKGINCIGEWHAEDQSIKECWGLFVLFLQIRFRFLLVLWKGWMHCRSVNFTVPYSKPSVISEAKYNFKISFHYTKSKLFCHVKTLAGVWLRHMKLILLPVRGMRTSIWMVVWPTESRDDSSSPLCQVAEL